MYETTHMWPKDKSKLESLPLIAPSPPSLPEASFRATRTEVVWGPWKERRSGRDRRATPRARVALVCEERQASNATYRLTWDLSSFGLSTQFGDTHPVGTRLDLSLSLPDGDPAPLTLAAKVVAKNQSRGGIRVAFIGPPIEAIRRINRFILQSQTAASARS